VDGVEARSSSVRRSPRNCPRCGASSARTERAIQISYLLSHARAGVRECACSNEQCMARDPPRAHACPLAALAAEDEAKPRAEPSRTYRWQRHCVAWCASTAAFKCARTEWPSFSARSGAALRNDNPNASILNLYRRAIFSEYAFRKSQKATQSTTSDRAGLQGPRAKLTRWGSEETFAGSYRDSQTRDYVTHGKLSGNAPRRL